MNMINTLQVHNISFKTTYPVPVNGLILWYVRKLVSAGCEIAFVAGACVYLVA